jgi:hypothetical protein
VAPGEAASSSPKSESAEMITRSFARGVLQDGLVGGGDQAGISDVPGIEPGAA